MATSKPKKISDLSYEAALQELKDELARIESQSVPLDALLQTYARCQELLAYCRSKLAVVEQQIQQIEVSAEAPPAAATRAPRTQAATATPKRPAATDFENSDDDFPF